MKTNHKTCFFWGGGVLSALPAARLHAFVLSSLISTVAAFVVRVRVVDLLAIVAARGNTAACGPCCDTSCGEVGSCHVASVLPGSVPVGLLQHA